MENPAAVSLLNGNPATTEEQPIHVLYVDDEAGLLKAAKPILEMQGSFHVETLMLSFPTILCPGKMGLNF
jgi:hypothetical protein